MLIIIQMKDKSPIIFFGLRKLFCLQLKLMTKVGKNDKIHLLNIK